METTNNNTPENNEEVENETSKTKVENQQEVEPKQEAPKEEKPLTPDQELYRKGMSQGFKLAKRDPKLAEEIRNEMSTGHLLQAGFMKGIKTELSRTEEERIKKLNEAREKTQGQSKNNER